MQPAGATFDPPVEISYPNMSGLPPGAITHFMSFDHDTNRFEVVASAHVSDDGRFIVSDPGVGITKAGWGGRRRPTTIGGLIWRWLCRVFGFCDPENPDDAPPTSSSEDPNGEGGDDDPTDPIYLFSGELYQSVTDLRIKGRGFDFRWRRKYRSKIGPDMLQGNGWDFSYNIFIRQQDENIVLCDGNSREDTYRPHASGVWWHPGFFRNLKRNKDETFTLEFEDKRQWNFLPFDERPEAGKISSIVDRNGNRMSFAYDSLGRLATVTDTLDRAINIGYDGDGYIGAVTDFAGRQVSYTYYNINSSGGSTGDLRSVRSPVVLDTPTGNNFPEGKVTFYTYTRDTGDDRLDHNLLTVMDPKGQVYLQNEYYPTTDPKDFNYDRVKRQTWGDDGDVIDLVYLRLDPFSFSRASTRVIMNDRVGNVSEKFYDRFNRLVIERAYTGRADPDQPTTDSENRPTGKLREEDPEFFETRHE